MDRYLFVILVGMILWTTGAFLMGMWYQDSRYDHVPVFPEVQHPVPVN